MAINLIRRICRKFLRTSAWRMRKGVHFTRFAMYGRLAEIPATVGPEMKCLSISHSEALARLFGFQEQQIIPADYPEFNMLQLPHAEGTFDWVVADQVLEHVEGDPQRVFDEARRVLRPGGIVVVTTCFMQRIHDGPEDLWRFTPFALRYLARDFSRVLQAEGWGNAAIHVLIWLGMQTDPVPISRWHPLHQLALRNSPRIPFVTWIVAEK